MTTYLYSESFYLSHTEGSYTGWGRGVAQERDITNLRYTISLLCI